MVVVVLLDLFMQRAEQVSIQVNDGLTPLTQEVVMRPPLPGFVGRLFGGKVILDYQPQFFEQVERAVDGGKGDLRVLGLRLL
jgi:hypothetical protein